LAPQLIAPTPEPQRDEATLPVPETVLVDPRVQFNRDELTPTGVPEGVIGPPVAGPGSDGGAGWGNGGGIGPGNGRGVGPGNDWNLGGKWPAIGGDPRDLEGNTPVRVDSKPVPLNWPRPNYTEEARQHKIEGVVRARVLVGSDGSVQSVVVTAGLPYGLSEEAIRAIKQMRFRPAMKAGRAVTFWISFEVEFNLR
jgi:protein TonB